MFLLRKTKLDELMRFGPHFLRKSPSWLWQAPSGGFSKSKTTLFVETFTFVVVFLSDFVIFVYICQIWPPNSELLALRSAACAQDLASRNSSADPGYPPDPVKVALGPLLRTPLHSRRGLG